MRQFWDARAAEDAFFFVDNRLDYGHPDEERFWAGGEEALTRLLTMLDASVEPGAKLVEIGCGLGRVTRALVGRGATVEAVDVSPEMLARAARLNAHLDGVRWIVGDGKTLGEVADSSVDGCVSLIVFQHIPDPAITLGYIREMGRALRPGGWAAFQVSNDFAIHEEVPPTRRLRDIYRVLRGRGPRGQNHPAWRGSAVELDALRAAAAAGNMDVVKIVGEGTQYCFVRLEKRP
jgi:SAM-dependent methyltransferase